MTTARQVITRSLRQLGIVDPEETPTDTQMDTGLEALNAMVHGWKAQSVDISHEDWTVDDDVTIELDPMHVNGMTALLCGTLQPEFPGSVLSPEIVAMATTGWAGLQAAYFDSSIDSELTVDSGFKRLQANRRWGWW